jgi:hypothetical protein
MIQFTSFTTLFSTSSSFALHETGHSTFVDQSHVRASERPGRPMKWRSANELITIDENESLIIK